LLIMKKNFSRREVLGMGAIAGSAVLGACATALSTTHAPEPILEMKFPWEYKILDIKKTQTRAYHGYFKGGCMYGVFEAIACQVAETLGKPYINFPFALSSYGGGGVALWGTLCGTCNGAAMAIAMFHKSALRNRLINEVYTWYEGTGLPVFVPDKPVKVTKNFKMKSSQAKSTLCHVSITRWTQASGFQSFSPERVERCGRVVANVAGYTANLLNEAALRKFTPKNQVSDVTNNCLSCHAKGKQAPNEPEVVSKMYCTTCHEDPHNR
jgi:hypothetical protein